MSKSSNITPWPRGFDEHQEQQIIRMARDSTPAQRLAWVEEMLELMILTGEPYLERKNRFKSKVEIR